jgi:hypothetical protein
MDCGCLVDHGSVCMRHPPVTPTNFPSRWSDKPGLPECPHPPPAFERSVTLLHFFAKPCIQCNCQSPTEPPSSCQHLLNADLLRRKLTYDLERISSQRVFPWLSVVVRGTQKTKIFITDCFFKFFYAPNKTLMDVYKHQNKRHHLRHLYTTKP